MKSLGANTNRKLKLSIALLIASTLMFVIPETTAAFSGVPWHLLDASHWITIVSLVCGFYFGSNVATKYVYQKGGGTDAGEHSGIQRPVVEDQRPGEYL